MKISAAAALLGLLAVPLSATPVASNKNANPIEGPVQPVEPVGPGDRGDRIVTRPPGPPEDLDDPIGIRPPKTPGPPENWEDRLVTIQPIDTDTDIDFERLTQPIFLPLEVEDPGANFTVFPNTTLEQADGDKIKLEPSTQCGAVMWGPLIVDDTWGNGRLGMTQRWKVEARDVDDDIPAMCHRLWKGLKMFSGCSVWGLPMYRPSCREVADERPGHKHVYWQFETSLFCSNRKVQAAWWEATHNRHGALECPRRVDW